MKSPSPLVLAFCFSAFTSLAVARLDYKAVFERTINGSSCMSPQGKGTCQKSSDCKGISYYGLCPKDPADVKCCVEIECEADGGKGLCSSVKGNGCSGGKFFPNHCPGDDDTQCCIHHADPAPKPVPDPVPDSHAWPHCQTTLSCTYAQIAAQDFRTRLAFLQHMESSFFQPLHADNQFRPVEGVLHFFISADLGTNTESWISYVDAGIIEGIERGGAIALGLSSDTGGNPGSDVWAKFLRGMRDGDLHDRGDHDAAWGNAEQASTDYGAKLADHKFSRTHQERNWYWATQLFRLIMRHRTISTIALGELNPEFDNWLTNVKSEAPGECLSEVAWFFAGVLDEDGPPVLRDIRNIEAAGKLIKELYECIKRNI